LTIKSRADASAVSAAFPLFFVLLWSTGFIGAKLGLPDAPPLTFLTTRYAAVIVFMAVVVVVSRAPWPDKPAAWLHIAVTGLLIHAVYLGGVFTSIDRGLPTSIAAMVVGLQPLVTALGAMAFLRERVGRWQWCGLVLGFIGVGMVVMQKNGDTTGTGMFYMAIPSMVALLGISAGTLYQKRFCPSFDLRTGSLIQFVPCLAVTWAAAAATETMHITWSANFLFALAWLVLVLSVGAISLLNMLIRRGSAVAVASLFYLTPPATALIAWLVFGETLSLVASAGMALTALGVWLARRG